MTANAKGLRSYPGCMGLDDASIAKAVKACTTRLELPFMGLTLRVKTDTPALAAALESYYADFLTARPDAAWNTADPTAQTLCLIDRQADIHAAQWTPLERDRPSPLGLKEAIAEAPDGRWVLKVRTGVVMRQSMTAPLAIGRLSQHFSQAVNFINNQVLNHQQRGGYLLGHASAFAIDGQVTAIAASSGGGKSTLMLKALEASRAQFVSNDRILLRALPETGDTEVLGVAKHPRVNPGTLLNSPRLEALLDADQRAYLARLPRAALWALEQKHDVPITDTFGANRTALAGRLCHLILLDWSLESKRPTCLSTVDLAQHPQALDGLRKPPGVFFQRHDGHFPSLDAPACQAYAKQLLGVQVWRLDGAIDFARALALLDAEGML